LIRNQVDDERHFNIYPLNLIVKFHIGFAEEFKVSQLSDIASKVITHSQFDNFKVHNVESLDSILLFRIET